MARMVVVIGMPDGDWEVPLSVIQSDWETWRAKCFAERDPEASDYGVSSDEPATWSEFANDWGAVENYVKEGLSWQSVKEHAALRPNTAPVPDYDYEWDTACFTVQRKTAPG